MPWMMALRFDRALLRDIGDGLPKEVRDEMAIPSYLHANPLVRWLVARRMRRVLRLMRIGEDERLLDFGCGVGMLVLQLPPRRDVTYCVDIHLEPARAMLAGEHEERSIAFLDAEDWHEHVADGSLDCIVALEVLEHVTDVGAVAEVFRRKLAAAGRLVICGPTENWIYKVARWIAGFSGHYHRREIGEIMRSVQGAGFALETQTAIPLPRPLALFVAARYRRADAR